jgi:ornithine carrier protein
LNASSCFPQYRTAQNAVKSAFYPEMRYDPEKELPYHVLLYCGAISGAFTSLFLTPIELVKCKMQVPMDTQGVNIARPGIVNIIGSIYRHQGLMGYWHGQMGTLIRESGGSAAWFGGYEGMKLLFRNFNRPMAGHERDELPVYQRMTAGAAAGMAYNFLFYPADTIKSRMQTEDVKQMTGGRSTFGAVGKALWRQHGLKGLYRGCGITVARSAPSSAFIFTVYGELVKRWPERHANV